MNPRILKIDEANNCNVQQITLERGLELKPNARVRIDIARNGDLYLLMGIEDSEGILTLGDTEAVLINMKYCVDPYDVVRDVLVDLSGFFLHGEGSFGDHMKLVLDCMLAQFGHIHFSRGPALTVNARFTYETPSGIIREEILLREEEGVEQIFTFLP